MVSKNCSKQTHRKAGWPWQPFSQAPSATGPVKQTGFALTAELEDEIFRFDNRCRKSGYGRAIVALVLHCRRRRGNGGGTNHLRGPFRRWAVALTVLSSAPAISCRAARALRLKSCSTSISSSLSPIVWRARCSKSIGLVAAAGAPPKLSGASKAILTAAISEIPLSRRFLFRVTSVSYLRIEAGAISLNYGVTRAKIFCYG